MGPRRFRVKGLLGGCLEAISYFSAAILPEKQLQLEFLQGAKLSIVKAVPRS